MTVKTKKLDITARLETDEDIREFLREIAQTGGTSVLIHALNLEHCRARQGYDRNSQTG